MKTKNKSVPCCSCGTRQTITFPENALSAIWVCQVPYCGVENLVQFKIVKNKTTKIGKAIPNT